MDNLSASFHKSASLGMEEVTNNATTTPKNEDSRPRRVEDLAQFYYPIPRAPKNSSDVRRGKRSRFFSFSKRGERKDETPHQDISIHSKKGGAKNSFTRESRDEHEEAYESDLASVSGIQSSRDGDETVEDYDDDVSHDALKSFEKGYEGKKREEFCIRQIKIPTSRSTLQPIEMPSPLVTNNNNNSNNNSNNNNWGLASAFIVVPDENTPQGALNQPDMYPPIGIDKNMVNSGSPLFSQGGCQVVPVSPPPAAK
jgi:hypothetical protein